MERMRSLLGGSTRVSVWGDSDWIQMCWQTSITALEQPRWETECEADSQWNSQSTVCFHKLFDGSLTQPSSQPCNLPFWQERSNQTFSPPLPWIFSRFLSSLFFSVFHRPILIFVTYLLYLFATNTYWVPFIAVQLFFITTDSKFYLSELWIHRCTLTWGFI